MRRPGGLTIAAPLALIASLGGMGCPQSGAVRDGAEPAEALRAELAGCAEVWRRGASRECGLAAEPTELRLVGALDTPRIEAASDGARLRLERDSEGAWRLLGARAGALVIRDGARRGRWELLGPLSDPELARAAAARRGGDLREAEAILRSVEAGGDRRRAARALAARARVVLASGDREAALGVLRQSRERSAALGFVSQALRDGLAEADTLRRLGRVGEARRRLDALEPTLDYPEGGVHRAYQSALAARDGGDLRAALAALERAEAGARSLGMSLVMLDVAMVRARILQPLGRGAEAAAGLAAVEPRAVAPCDRAAWATNRGWLALLEAEQGVAPDAMAPLVALARESFGEAARLHGGACPDPARARNAAVNSALAALLLGHDDAARAHLAEARAAGAAADARVAAWQDLVDARSTLAAGRSAAAADGFARLARRAEARGFDGIAWRAWLGLGRAERRGGRLREATEALLAAEAVLDRQVERVPLGEGRGAFAATRSASAEGLVDLWLERGRPDRALRAARWARGRALRSVRRRARWLALAEAPAHGDRLAAYRGAREAEREHALASWGVPLDEEAAHEERARALRAASRRALDVLLAAIPAEPAALRPLVPGETLVTWARGASGWVAFAATGVQGRPARVLARRMGELPAPPDGADATSPLLAPLADELATAEVLRVVLPPELEGVPVQRLPLRGAPLLEHAPIVFALDAGSPSAGSGEPKEATLVVADPRGDLPGARREGRALARRAPGATLLVGAEASRGAVLRGLERAGVFHYAGHAEAGGHEGLDGRLLLANDETLSVDDILAGLPVPRAVLLLACETGRARGLAGRGTPLGLARAFALGGAEAVVATTREVSDRASAALARELGPAAPTPAGFRRALLSLRAHHDEWGAFRLVVP